MPKLTSVACHEELAVLSSNTIYLTDYLCSSRSAEDEEDGAEEAVGGL